MAAPTRRLMRFANTTPAIVLTAAALYALVARLALWMAIPPGYATAVWPAAGLALVGVLIRRRAAFGVALGSFAVNIATGFDDTSALAVVISCGVTAAIAIAAALQALVGAALVRRVIGFPSPLHDEHDVVWFIVLGGPVACLVCATLSVTALALAGTVAWSAFAFHWWTWWVGDTIGVLVFAPLALLALPGAHPVWRRRRGIVGVPLVLGFAAVTLLFVRVSSWERARLRRDFERRSVPIEAVLRSHLSSYQEVVTSLASFFDASEEVTRREFLTFCSRALAEYPALTALSWNPHVRAAQRPELESRARREGLAGFSITELAPDGSLRVAGERLDYAPVYYIEPAAGNAFVLGYDARSDDLRRDAFDQASRLGRVIATRRIDLLQGAARPPGDGVLLVSPAYDHASAHQLVGYTVGVFRLQDVVESALRGIDHDGMDVALFDRSAPGGDELLYRSGAGPLRRDGQRWPIEFGERQWQLEIAPSAAFLAGQRSWEAWTVLAAGLLFVGLLGVVLLITTGRTYRMYEGAERFRALVEASAQIVWTTDASGAVVEDSPSWRAFTGQTFEQWRSWGRRDAIHPDDQVGFDEGWQQVIAARQPVQSEYRIRHVGGEWRWVVGRSVPLLDAQGALRGWVMSNDDITDRRRAADQLRQLNAELEQRVQARTGELTAALREREVLLQEIHHRVKNNLQVISSLINMQVRKVTGAADRAALEDCQIRVQAIALIHEQLYQSHDYANVPFSEYTRVLVNNVFRTMGVSPDSIKLDLAIEEVAVPVDKAIPCGLLLNELITNALKHAFKDRTDGELRVELARTDGNIRLVVEDNGVGLPADLDVRGASSLGLRLVNTLVRQLQATLAIGDHAGARFELNFAVES